MQTLIDAETGQRGFLLTQDESFLSVYEKAMTNVRANLSAVAELVKVRPLKKSGCRNSSG